MFIAFIILIVLSILICSYTGQLSNFVIPVLFFVIGLCLIRLNSDKKNINTYSKLYSIAFLVYLAYAEMCYVYMRECHYPCLLVSDTVTAYIPWVQDFMRESSLQEMMDLLYGDVVSHYSHAGIILLYWTAVAKFSALFGQELYFNLQVSVLFLSAFVPIFLYRLLAQNNIRKPFKLSLIYSFLSVFCFYATLILRDAPIALLYLIAFSYLFVEQSLKKNVVIISMILLSYLIRPQMGLFLFLFYFISFFPNTKEIKVRDVFLIILAASVISLVMINMDIVGALEQNEFYAEDNAAHDADSRIHALNRLPPIISELSKVLFIQLSPIPSWAYMGIQTASNATNNIMGFPRMIAVLYNYVILGFIIYGVFKYRRFSFSSKHTLVFLAALLFLMLQCSSTEQRRIMICYPILFMFSAAVFQKTTAKDREGILFICGIVFLLFQIIGYLKY